MEKTLLEMKDIEKQFPGVHALKKCFFSLREGEIHALVGENGAGKSTLMNILTGCIPYDSGDIFLDGEKKSFSAPRQAQDAGISMVHQELNLMENLTVAQNIFIGRESKGLLLNEDSINKRAMELFKRLNFHIDPKEKVGNLSVSLQQIVEIAKAISYNAKIIVFDEPSATLTDTEINQLFKIMKELRETGVSMIYISHRMDEIKRISDRVTVMRDGEYIGTRDSASVEIDEVIQMMVGRVIYEEHKKISIIGKDTPVVMKAEHFSSRDVKDVSFELFQGEILGFAGLIGAGRTELARLIFGADPKDTGDLYLKGEKLDITSPFKAVEKGIGYLSEDRKRYGVVLGMSIANNIVLTKLKDFVTRFFIRDKDINKTAEEYVKKIDIRTPGTRQLVRSLSGGNQQKVIIAKWLLNNSDVLIFDEPTRGIDVGAKSEIYKIMNDLAEQGKSIIMISSELPELIRMSDRVLVMCEGRHTATLAGDDITQNTIMKYATKQ
ncbi:MAG TPA: sugar ABC transporter ATP-binding protein [Clostridia bacterium]|nr:sugar ABC transporter ATP-binding protein [Clostridia bacterium]HRX41183.1 sugar ABC transporter ATP-binding protein [Clostridia bacterium]